MRLRTAEVNQEITLVVEAYFPWSIVLVFQLELRGEVLLRLRRDRGVVAEFDCVGALPAGHRSQPGLILGHLREGHHAEDRHEVATGGFGAGDLPALAREVG